MGKSKFKNRLHSIVTIKTKDKFLVTGILFSIIGIVAIGWMLHFTLKETNVKQPNKHIPEINIENALKIFETKVKLENDSWFTNTYAMPDSILAISTDLKALILKTEKKVDTICYYTPVSGNNHVKNVPPKDTAQFNAFLNKSFSILDTILVDSFNAQSDYSAEVLKAKNLSRSDVIFSLIYNKIVGGQKGQIAVTIQNKKLNVLKASDMRCDHIDLVRLAESMKYIYEKDTLSAEDKYVIARYQERFLNKENISNNTDKDTLWQKVVTFLENENSIILDKKLSFQFVYLNFRGDKLYVGEEAHNILQKLDDEIKTIYDMVVKNPEKIYYLYQDSKLYELPNLPKSDSLLWGTIDRDLLSKAQMTNTDESQNQALIQNSSNDFIWAAIGLVFLTIGLVWLVLWLAFKNSKGNIIIERPEEYPADTSLDDFLNPIRNIKDCNMAIEQLIKSYDTYCTGKDAKHIPLMPTFDEYKQFNLFLEIRKKKQDTVEKVLEVYDMIFNASKKNELAEIELNAKLKILNKVSGKNVSKDKMDDIIREIIQKREFYEELERNKDKKGALIQLLEKEFKVKIDLTIKEWFEERKAKSKNDNDLLIEYILSDLDENLKNIFINYRKKSILYDQYLPFIQETQGIIEKFVSEYSRNKKIKSVTLKSMFIGTSAVSDLAFPLLETWHKIPQGFENDVMKTVETLKQELLENLGVKMLNNAYYQNTIQDFNKEKATLQGYINDFNTTNQAYKLAIDENHWRTLFEWSVKIKKSDGCKLFVDNMYHFFVSDFLKDIKKKDLNLQADKAWLFEKLFNITFHTVDYVDWAKKEIIPTTQFNNYELLCNGLDFSKTKNKDFLHKDADMSNPFSNAIYELASALKIKELKILIDKFQIKL